MSNISDVGLNIIFNPIGRLYSCSFSFFAGFAIDTNLKFYPLYFVPNLSNEL